MFAFKAAKQVSYCWFQHSDPATDTKCAEFLLRHQDVVLLSL